MSNPREEKQKAVRAYQAAKDDLRKFKKESAEFWKANNKVIEAEKRVGWFTKLMESGR